MKGVRFYLEYPNKTEKNKATRKELGNHIGNVVGLLYENKAISNYGKLIYDAFVGLFDKPNSPVCSSTVPQDYLDENCKRISEELAREIHPELFRILDEVH